jgi:hypothetical protein
MKRFMSPYLYSMALNQRKSSSEANMNVRTKCIVASRHSQKVRSAQKRLNSGWERDVIERAFCDLGQPTGLL